MATNVNQEEIIASDSSYSEEENEVEIFDENGNLFDLDQHICKVVSKVPLIKESSKRGRMYNLIALTVKTTSHLDFAKCSD